MQKKCEICKKDFDTNGTNAKICGDVCRKIKRRDKQTKFRNENRELYRQQQRNYMRLHPEKRCKANPETKRRWAERNKERRKLCNREWALKNADRKRFIHKRWCEKNPERVKQHAINSYRRNIDRFRDYQKRYYEENKDWIRFRNYTKYRYSLHDKRVRKATPKWADKHSINSVYKTAHNLSWRDDMDYHVDHIIPLRGKDVSGLHVHDNLRIIFSEINMKKNNKWDQMSLGGN